MASRDSWRGLVLPMVVALATVTAFVAGVAPPQAVQASGPVAPPGTPQVTPSGCPLVSTKQSNFNMGSSTGTVDLNLYASRALACFNGYERIFVSSGSDELAADSAGDDWLQFWFSTNGGTTYTPICAYEFSCNTPSEYEYCYPGYYGGAAVDAAFLINASNYGTCTGAAFTFPRTSMAWVEAEDWAMNLGSSSDCVLIQNYPNPNFPYTINEQVYDIHNNIYQVPSFELHFCG